MPLDSTPAKFDTQFYLEVILPHTSDFSRFKQYSYIFVQVLLEGVGFPGNGSNRGEALSSSPHQLRIQSDYNLARDSRYAQNCASVMISRLLTNALECPALGNLTSVI